MKYLLALMILTTSLAAKADGWETDKSAHFFASYAIESSLYRALRHEEIPRLETHLLSGGLTLAIGLAKESLDAQFDGDDMKANLLGVLCSKGFSFAFDF